MPANVECKARYEDQKLARGILRKLGAHYEGTERQIDTYYVVPRGRLKLREINGSDSELIYYDRKEEGGRRDCTYEIFRHPRSRVLKELLRSAFGQDILVAKSREVHWLGNTKVNLDEVDGLGRFIEFEVRVEDGDFQAADARVKELTSLFGIDEGNIITCSYVDLMRGEQGG